jgi:hypothetical protein
MPSALRAQVALILLLAVLLIPIGTSSLRGLTHILTCEDEAATPFSVEVPADGPPIVSSSTVIERGPDGAATTGEVCGGLTLDLQIGGQRANHADVTLTIANNTDYGWRGSVRLHLEDTDIPIDIGEIAAGGAARDSFELTVDEGRTYAIDGDLLVGP